MLTHAVRGRIAQIAGCRIDEMEAAYSARLPEEERRHIDRQVEEGLLVNDGGRLKPSVTGMFSLVSVREL